MKQDLIVKLFTVFEACVKLDAEGREFWTARDLQELLGYTKWDNFQEVIGRAQTACQKSGQLVDNHFAETGKMVGLGSGSQRQVDDVALSRYACYLIAQNGDPKKEAVAFAQTYFAAQTRNQELIAKRIGEIERLSAREKLTASERVLSGLIHSRLGDAQSFGRIRSQGDKALFGGQTTQDMKRRLGVPEGRALADFLQTVIIKGKDFANEVTNFSVQRDGLATEHAITQEHVRNNQGVRDLLGKRNIKPEALPAAEDAKKVDRRLKAETKKLPECLESPEPETDDDQPSLL